MNYHSASRSACTGSKLTQGGFTLVELMVAMIISLLIALAAVSALIVSRQGFTTVDASSQLRDNARFASDLIQRIAVQTGYKDRMYVALESAVAPAGVTSNPVPNITGFNNAKASTTDPEYTTSSWSAGAVGRGSDILIMRYQAAESFPGSGVADKSMINCNGAHLTTLPSNAYDREVSIFHVKLDNSNEPALYCTTVSSTGTIDTQPIIRGVENFQVLYGTDGAVAGTAPPTNAAAAALITDYVPERYLRAGQINVTGDLIGTYANWRRVRSIRIGMVLRGPPNSSQDKNTQTFFPLGAGKDSAGGVVGSAYANNTNDVNTSFTPTPDGRLRQVVTFTVHLRNDQGLPR